MKRDELLNWMPHIEAEFDRRGLDTYAMLVSRATEMLQRDEETIAALEAERDQLLNEIQLITAPHDSVGAVIAGIRAERDQLRAELAEFKKSMRDAAQTARLLGLGFSSVDHRQALAAELYMRLNALAEGGE